MGRRISVHGTKGVLVSLFLIIAAGAGARAGRRWKRRGGFSNVIQRPGLERLAG